MPLPLALGRNRRRGPKRQARESKLTESELLNALEDSLVTACRQTLAAAHTKYPEERFYAFVLYTEPGLLAYIIPSFNSEEALIRTVPTESDELRWNPPEWPYHGEGADLFSDVQQILALLEGCQGSENPEGRERRLRS